MPFELLNVDDAGPRRLTDVRVLFTIRWVAIFGQSSALLFTHFFLGIDLPLIAALFVISMSVLVNLWQIKQSPRGQVPYPQYMVVLGFDILQLAALLYLTGGLLNPFSVMIVAPVVVSAAVLRQKATLMLVGLVAASVSFLVFFNHPLNWGQVVKLPPFYLGGIWMALILSSCFFGVYIWWVAASARQLSAALTDAKLALVEEQQVRALGSLATAAAHKLGSPLNTITVISHELAGDISPDDPIYDDIQLLRTEIERCRVILGELDVVQGRRPIDEEPPLPVTQLVDEVLYQRLSLNDARFLITHGGASDDDVPNVSRQTELLHAVENILQNAAQFSKHDVSIHIEWTADDIHISINDDGDGFARPVLIRAGQPWNTSRAGQDGHRGLGLFIARSLVDSIGGSIQFSNLKAGGAKVDIKVPRAAL